VVISFVLNRKKYKMTLHSEPVRGNIGQCINRRLTQPFLDTALAPPSTGTKKHAIIKIQKNKYNRKSQ